MWRRLLATPDDSAMLVLRLALAVMILPHGLQKMFGWFGGYGFSGTLEFFSQSFPVVLGVLAILAEFVGGIFLILGLLTRVAALGVGTNMVVAMFTVHWQNGFFMNWSGQQQGEGIEFFILAIGIALALIIRGGGLWSIDRGIVEWRRKERAIDATMKATDHVHIRR